jgi:hypothetical protein
VGDWNFLSDEERQKATQAARRPPLTWARVGQITGGTVACWTTAAVCFLAFWVQWRFDLRELAVYGALTLAALFAGAAVGQKVGARFDRKPDGGGERPT